MKKLFTVAIGVLIVVLALSFTKNIIIKASVEKGVELATGLPLSMRSFNVGVINTIVGIEDLTLFNPKEYPDKIMLSMPEIYVDYDLPAIFKGKIHLEELRINLSEFTVVRNKKGELNLNSLKVVKAQKEGKKAPAAKKGKAPKLQIDSLEFTIGKVIYKDYSLGPIPVIKETNINISERYKNITDLHSLVSLIVVKSVMNTNIANLTDFDIRGLKGTIPDVLGTADKLVAEAATRVKETTEALKKAGEGLKEKLKNPF